MTTIKFSFFKKFFEAPRPPVARKNTFIPPRVVSTGGHRPWAQLAALMVPAVGPMGLTSTTGPL